MSFERVEQSVILETCRVPMVDHAVLTRVNKAWNKFREFKSFLCAKRIGLNVKGKVYEACVRSCVIFGEET